MSKLYFKSFHGDEICLDLKFFEKPENCRFDIKKLKKNNNSISFFVVLALVHPFV